ncbi:MAG: hypothetical protein PUB37_10355 [Firmicutes bacterium]|nr:hypothetical protein [Bacillota bacterium]
MTPYEQMAKFEIGMEMGLLTVDELRGFLTEALRGQDVPYIYTDVYFSLNKGSEAVIEAIFYNLNGKYSMDKSDGSNLQRMLIGVIKNKFDGGEINMDQCVHYLHELTNYFECGWNLLSLDEYYRLTKSGYHSEDEFNSILDKIFSQAL